MFKKSRVKIVAAIMSVLVLLLFGTFCVIYISRYVDVTNENREMLRQYVDSYRLPGTDDPGTEANDPGAERERRGLERRPDMPPMAELSPFYTVAISNSGEVLNVDTADIFENGLTLETEIDSDVRVRGNGTQLRQLNSILIDNAIRYGEKGKEVCLLLKKEKDSAVLSVINDGEEIPPEQQKIKVLKAMEGPMKPDQYGRTVIRNLYLIRTITGSYGIPSRSLYIKRSCGYAATGRQALTAQYDPVPSG